MAQDKKGKPTFIKMDAPPMKDSKVDIAAILAANGITGVDLSKVKIIQADNAGDAATLLKEVQKP